MKALGKFIVSILILSSCNRFDADLLVYNAAVYTVDPAFTVASAFAVKDGKFVAVGNEDLLNQYTAAATLDMNGLPIYPGFIDAHCHFYQLGLGQTQADLRGAKSVREIILRLEKHSRGQQSNVLLGRGWDQNLWEDKQFPTKAALDAAFPDQFVVLERVDGHAAWVNSKVLSAAAIDNQTKVEGGEVLLANRTPTGVLIDKASDLAYAILPQPNRAQQIAALQAAESIAFSKGLTTVDDAGLDRDVLTLIDSLHQTEDLKIRLYGMISNTPENLSYYLDRGITQTERLTIRSVKVYADGALGSRGAALQSDYSDDPHNKGLFITPAAKIDSLAQILAEKGFQMNTHAIGDAANAAVLQAYENVLGTIEDPRWRVEHAQVVLPQDIEKFGPKVLPSVQPTHATSDMYWAEERLGGDRVKSAYTYKSLLDWSGKIALGTDFPVEHVNPVYTFYAATLRKDHQGYPQGGFQMENALTRSEALKGMTIWAAYANFEEAQKGSIEVGKAADFVMMTKDIMTATAEEMLDTEVLATFVDGEMVYQRKK